MGPLVETSIIEILKLLFFYSVIEYYGAVLFCILDEYKKRAGASICRITWIAYGQPVGSQNYSKARISAYRIASVETAAYIGGLLTLPLSESEYSKTNMVS